MHASLIVQTRLIFTSLIKSTTVKIINTYVIHSSIGKKLAIEIQNWPMGRYFFPSSKLPDFIKWRSAYFTTDARKKAEEHVICDQ